MVLSYLNRMYVVYVMYADQGGRTSSKNDVDIPFLGMRKVHGDLQRLNK